MVETISHVSFSPLENEVALWEIKARPFEVLMEFQRKGLLSEGIGTLRVFSYYCSVPQLSESTRGKPTCAQHKGEFVRPSNERQSPYEPWNPKLPTTLGFLAVLPQW